MIARRARRLSFATAMPAARKSRRRIRRAPSSDNIEEEDDPSQRHADDVDNDEDSEEDVQPVRKKVTVKKEKKPKINGGDVDPPVAGPSNAHDRNDGDDDDRIDIENFRDQPLDKKEGAKLHGIAQDWEMIRKQIHQSSFRLVKDVAISLADVMEVGKAEEVSAVIPPSIVANEYSVSGARRGGRHHEKAPRYRQRDALS